MRDFDLAGLLPRRWSVAPYSPSLVEYVPTPYWLGGFEVALGITLSIDKAGLEWVRTLHMRSLAEAIEYRMIHPDDMHVLIGPYPSDETVRQIYGKPIQYEVLPARLRK